MALSERPNRRTVLLSIGAVATASLSGCVGSVFDDSYTPDTFPYPDGFGSDTFDLQGAFGVDSPTAQLDSVTITYDQEMSLPIGSISYTETERIDGHLQRFLREENEHNHMRNELRVANAYFDGDEVIRRVKVEPRSIDYRYGAQSHTFDRVTDYNLGQLQELLADVDLSVSEIDDGEDEPLAVYTADTADFSDTAAVVTALDGALEEASAEVRITEDGVLDIVHVTTAFHSGDDRSSMEGSWAYAKPNATTVERPDWIDGIEGLERPDVDVTFDDSIEEGVAVSIEAMDDTDEVAIVVSEEGVVHGRTAPGTVTVTYDEILTDNDEVQVILVYAENALRGPVQVASYHPTVPSEDES